MGSIEVYDAKREKGFPMFQITMHGTNILKTLNILKKKYLKNI